MIDECNGSDVRAWAPEVSQLLPLLSGTTAVPMSGGLGSTTQGESSDLEPTESVQVRPLAEPPSQPPRTGEVKRFKPPPSFGGLVTQRDILGIELVSMKAG